MSPAVSYSIAVFFIILISGCAVNLLKEHFVFQLLGIAFFFTYIVINSAILFENTPETTLKAVFYRSLPSLVGISACLISMTLGFWIFPAVRKRFRD
jgi:hypothetical protein